MFSLQLVVLALVGVQISSAQDDGQYRPQLYGGDDGSYRPRDYGGYYQSRYGTFGSNGKYASIASSFQPAFAYGLNRLVNNLIRLTHTYIITWDIFLDPDFVLELIY